MRGTERKVLFQMRAWCAQSFLKTRREVSLVYNVLASTPPLGGNAVLHLLARMGVEIHHHSKIHHPHSHPQGKVVMLVSVFVEEVVNEIHAALFHVAQPVSLNVDTIQTIDVSFPMGEIGWLRVCKG